ncbi:MAG: tRNA (N(6)-L-threonylcarbamoyladenosine(37)-C(2))-methylthiotransferase MtaB [Patescibacteria group bacterium]
MKFSIHTLGCKLNQAESDEIKNELKKSGHVCTPFSEKSDVAIIRACAVTAGASQTAREMIRRARRQGSFVIASGCLENRDLPEIDFIAETAGDIIKKIKQVSKKFSTTTSKHFEQPDRTRAMVKIQNGCNFNCAYCVIPKFRGKSQSEPASLIIKKIKQAEKNDYKEVILTGVNICQYGNNGCDLANLLKTILMNTKIERLRLGSLDPRLITDQLINQSSDKRLMPHWHLSLQSGSDTVLARMNRGYTTKKYLDIIKKNRQINPLFSFTTDIIVGFPGETDKEFKETLAFVKRACFTKVHVFPYSPRPNTSAAMSKDFVQDKTKSERVAQLIKISASVGKTFAKNFIGKTREILFEHKKNGYWLGYTPEYLSVRYKSEKNLNNKIVSLKLKPVNLQSQ